MNAAAELPTQGGHRLQLRADGSAFCPATRTLFAPDLHLGKGAAFRVQGEKIDRHFGWHPERGAAIRRHVG